MEYETTTTIAIEVTKYKKCNFQNSGTPPWAGRKNAVGMKHVEGFDLGVEELIGARRFPAVKLVRDGELRIEAAREDDLQQSEVPERVRPRALQQVANFALVVAHSGWQFNRIKKSQTPKNRTTMAATGFSKKSGGGHQAKKVKQKKSVSEFEVDRYNLGFCHLKK